MLATAAGPLISRQPDVPDDGAGAADTGVAGLGAGAASAQSLALYLQTRGVRALAGAWPARARGPRTRCDSLLVVVSRHVRSSLPFPTGADRTLALSAGVLDVTATTFLLLAVRRGLILVVAPLATLAPRGHGDPRPVRDRRTPAAPAQRIGLVLALVGLVLVAMG